MNSELKPVTFEVLPWKAKHDNIYISRQKRSQILSTYQSAIPSKISDMVLSLPESLSATIDELLIMLSRFDALQSQMSYSFPAMLLRSESAASSQIENLTSSIRNIALAELTEKAPQNAQLIVGNVSAMHTALRLPNDLSKSTILEIHHALISPSGESYAGQFRKQPVWIGGSNYSPHNAIFVPPRHELIEEYLNDLIFYSKRINVNPIVKAAIVHAQFETIHPFIDGNGRTGRTLLHKILKEEGVLTSVTLPISAGLLHDITGYMDAIKSYQSGNPLPIIHQLIDALELSINIGNKVSKEIDALKTEWEAIIPERRTSHIWGLIDLLIEQPVINSTYLAEKFDITLRSANGIIERAIEYGILKRFGTEKRGIFYQSSRIIEIMDQISDISQIRRIFYNT